jgi:hypothetical protein
MTDDNLSGTLADLGFNGFESLGANTPLTTKDETCPDTANGQR